MDWQQIITIGLVSLAAIYVLRRIYCRCAGRKTVACSGCNSCTAAGVSEDTATRPFVAADRLRTWADSPSPDD